MMQNTTTGNDFIVDDLDVFTGSEQTTGSDYIETEGDEAVNKPQRKDGSNFKKIYKENKMLREELNALKEVVYSKDETQEYDSDGPSDHNKIGQYEKADVFYYLMKNEEARGLDEEIQKALNRFPQMSLDEAFTYAKASKKDVQTSDTDDFDFISESAPKPRKLSDVKNEDDVYEMLKEGKITKDQLLSWKRANKLL